MRRDSRRQEVLDAFRELREATGVAPTFRELGQATGMSAPGAWKHVQDLIAEGAMLKWKAPRRGRPRAGLDLPDLVDLSPISTERLRGELARRGVTMDSLEEPQLLMDEGKACVAYHCTNRVRRGHLMCRDHWFQLPATMRSTIMNAWSTRNRRAYQDAIEAARDRLGGFTSVVRRVG